MFCFPLTLTHGSSVCIRLHFNSHISVELDFMRVVHYTFVIIVTLIIVMIMSFMSVGRSSSVHNFFLSFCAAFHLQWNFLQRMWKNSLHTVFRGWVEIHGFTPAISSVGSTPIEVAIIFCLFFFFFLASWFSILMFSLKFTSAFKLSL